PDLAKMSIGLTRDPDLIAMPDAFMTPPIPPGTPPAPNRPRNGQVSANGTFSLLIAPGDFRMNVNGTPANTYVKSIRMGGDDILRSGLHVPSSENQIQIVIGADGGAISGSVIDDTSHVVPNAIVALVPDLLDLRKRPDLYRNTVTDAAG